MKYTQEYMTKLFHFVNDELFAGMLDVPYMEALSEKEISVFWPVPIEGVCIPVETEDRCDYFIAVWSGLNEHDFFHTFVHELIHIQCLEYHNGFSGHYGWFRVYAERAVDTFYGEFKDV